MDEMYEMIELTDAELDAVAAGQTTVTFDDVGLVNVGLNFGVQIGIGEVEDNVNINFA